MGLLSRCALHSEIDDPAEWKGTDDDVWYMRWRLYVKHWFAFANRCPQGLDLTLVFFPGLFLLPFTIWFTGWSWWYLFPVGVLSVCRKWRLLPTTVFAIRGPGLWRLENSNSSTIVSLNATRVLFFPRLETSYMSVMTPFYLSRVQRWTRWHVRLDWPFFLSAHWYFKASDVPTPTNEHDTDGLLINGYRGWHRDEDEIFWGDSGFVGGVWK